MRVHGRPRSSEVHEAILRATRSLLVEAGHAKLTTDQVAHLAGVGIQTVYRRWPSKAPLVAEAVLDAVADAGWQNVFDTGDLRADLQAWMVTIEDFYTVPENRLLQRAMTAAACANPEDFDELYRQAAGPVHEAVLRRLHIAVVAGQLRGDVDTRAVADALVGATFYRSLIRHEEHLALSESLVDVLIAGAATVKSTLTCRRKREGGLA